MTLIHCSWTNLKLHTTKGDLSGHRHLFNSAHRRESSKAGHKRCKKFGYENCQTYQKLNIDGLEKTITFPNGEKVQICAQFLLNLFGQFEVVDLLKNGEVTTVMMISDRQTEATISFRKYSLNW